VVADVHEDGLGIVRDGVAKPVCEVVDDGIGDEFDGDGSDLSKQEVLFSQCI
jgi:hypothetical protein